VAAKFAVRRVELRGRFRGHDLIAVLDDERRRDRDREP
jgi:hypothetical protein